MARKTSVCVCVCVCVRACMRACVCGVCVCCMCSLVIDLIFSWFCVVLMWLHWPSPKSEISYWEWKSPLPPNRDSRLLKSRSKPKSSRSSRRPPHALPMSMATRSSSRQPATTRDRHSRQRRNGGSEPYRPPTSTFGPTISTSPPTISERLVSPTFYPKTFWRSSLSCPIYEHRLVGWPLIRCPDSISHQWDSIKAGLIWVDWDEILLLLYKY